MVCVPEASEEVAKAATPPLRGMLPSVFVPLLNVTVPAGVPLNCGATVAVKVTDSPKVDGFTDETRPVVVLAWFTTWLTAFEVLLVKDVSPLYTAVMECVPAAKVFDENFATPPLRVLVPSVLVPLLNVTVPVGVPPPDEGVTVALKVTDWPKVDGFSDEVRAVFVPVWVVEIAISKTVPPMVPVLPPP